MFNARSGRSRLLLAGLPIILAACFLLALHCATATAAGTVLSTGFENPPFVPGPLENQSGWLTAGSGTSSAIVQNSITHTGNQALLVTRTANSDRRWAVPQSGLPTQRFVTVDWDMRVSGTSSSSGFGPFFGVEGYDATSGVRLLGSLGVDATTGDVLYQIQDSGELTETGRTVAFNQWFHYKLVFDFLNDSYKGFVNGMLVADTGFPDRAFNLNSFTDADISAFAAGFDPVSQGLSSSAVIDNFIVRDGLLGDYDADGDVDNADYTRWRAEFGTSVTAGHGADGNGNGAVDAADYVVWRNNFGTSLFAGAGAEIGLGSIVVPEPASLLIAMLGAWAMALGSAQRRRRCSILPAARPCSCKRHEGRHGGQYERCRFRDGHAAR